MASAADGIGSLGTEQSHINVPVADPGAWATAMNNLGIVPMGLTGQQLVSDSICIHGFDPNLGIITPINPMMAGISLVPPHPVTAELPVIKEIIHCKSCTLFPQNPNLPPPSTRERPPGCKTVFVGGLPENATEEIIKEVFDQCGEIVAIRKSKKNFCHIRFCEEFMVDKALYLSGYRMRIGSSTDKKDSGRIHVDFAQARDDLYEWECKQRLLAREERHRRKIHEERLRPPSPPPIMHYSEHEATLWAEKLKDDNKFSEATAVLFTWIDRGEVNRRTANHFYSMIQSANSHVRRLMNEKAQHEEEMELAKEHFKNSLLAILTQFEQITAVFTAATRQKAWDHFSKAQRKNIDIWRKQCEELRNAHSEEIMGIRREEEMEMSDEDLEENPCKKMRMEDTGRPREALQPGVNFCPHSPCACSEKRNSTWQQEHRLLNAMESVDLTNHNSEGHEKGVNGTAALYHHREKNNDAVIWGPLRSEKEALLLGIISTFLHVHPFGANIEYLWSYIQRLDTKISASELEKLMVRLPNMFKQEFSGVGATLEKRWKFCGFEALKSA
ncbi:ecto-NOX disulfide-thiol exchanger 1 [Garra rufa]|uniref:ecto-NOX disulfide-thiol exchanger 1 n=1 Tax=Garra rufa TaxID=137080 RepID=UPI003CCEF4C2